MNDEAQPTETPRWSRDLCDLKLDGVLQACIARADQRRNAAIDGLIEAANRTVAAEARAEAAERERDRWFAERCEAQRESRRNIVCAEGAQRDRSAAVRRADEAEALAHELDGQVDSLAARPMLPEGAELVRYGRATGASGREFDTLMDHGAGSQWLPTPLDPGCDPELWNLLVVARRKPEPVPLTRSIPASEVRPGMVLMFGPASSAPLGNVRLHTWGDSYIVDACTINGNQVLHSVPADRLIEVPVDGSEDQ